MFDDCYYSACWRYRSCWCYYIGSSSAYSSLRLQHLPGMANCHTVKKMTSATESIVNESAECCGGEPGGIAKNARTGNARPSRAAADANPSRYEHLAQGRNRSIAPTPTRGRRHSSSLIMGTRGTEEGEAILPSMARLRAIPSRFPASTYQGVARKEAGRSQSKSMRTKL